MLKLSLRKAIWLLPASYVLHILEEGERFRTWAEMYWGPSSHAAKYFVVANAGLMSLMLIASLWFVLKPEKGGIIAGLAAGSWAVTNALIHIGYTLATGVYSPGVVTACLFYFPITVYLYSLVRSEGNLTARRFVLSILFGGGLMTAMFVSEIL